MKRWVKRIENTDTLYDMEQLIEEIALDATISNQEYEELYNMALNKLR